MSYVRLNAPLSETITNASGGAVDIVAYPAGRQPAVLGRLAPGQTQSFAVVEGDPVCAFDPVTRVELCRFVAGHGPFVVGGRGGPSSSSSSVYLPGGSSTALAVRPPTMPVPGGGDGTSTGKVKSRLSAIGNAAGQLRSMMDHANSDFRGRMHVSLRPGRTPGGPHKAPPPGGDPDRNKFEQLRVAVKGRLNFIRDAAKEVSVHLVMGDVPPEDQRSISVELTLTLDKVKAALGAIESFRVVEVYPPLPGNECCLALCCGAPPPDPVVPHSLINDPEIGNCIAEIKHHLDTENLNLSNMKVRMSADLGGSFTVGGSADLGYDNSARERTMRATSAMASMMPPAPVQEKLPTYSTPLTAGPPPPSYTTPSYGATTSNSYEPSYTYAYQ